VNKEKLESDLIELGFPELAELVAPAFNRITASADFSRFSEVLNSLPFVLPTYRDCNSAEVWIGEKSDLTNDQQETIYKLLKQLSPWRKGPFNIFGIGIDAEWRSDMKFARMEKSGFDFSGKTILDIGSGNGYYAYRLFGKGAKAVVGVEPYLLNFAQFSLLKKLTPDLPLHTIPCGIESLPQNYKKFDVVLSMGVFYHRKSPFDHLAELRNLTTPGGTIFLETLVIDGEDGEVLVPESRYAKMRNVWFIPTVKTLIKWLQRAKYKNATVLDVSKTTFAEQRKTEWMTYESLSDFLDKTNPALTIEGYPAPKRAMIVAEVD
jgi:tRNA (mo5U34)-methyltransferase